MGWWNGNTEQGVVVGKYRKTVVALVGAGVVIAGRLLGADSDAYFIIVTLATALGVYATPNAS